MHELPLVFFTVLTQSAVGAFLLLLIANGMGQIDSKRLGIGLFAAMCVFGVGLIIGMVHLGKLTRAFNLFLGIGRSPMSNEIALSALFTAVAGLASLGLVWNKGKQKLFRIMAWCGAVIGIAFVFSIPRVYQLETVAGWNTYYTTVIMVLTALTGGGLLAAVLGARKVGLGVGIAGILVSLLIRPSYLAVLWQSDSVMVSAQTVWFGVQITLLIVALLFALFGLLRRPAVGFAYVAVASVIVAELAGRIAFYNLWAIPM